MALVYRIEGDRAKIVAGINAKISSQGGTVTGDEKAGTFEVMGFGGGYSEVDGGVELTVDKKPMMIPDSMILAWLKENVS